MALDPAADEDRPESFVATMRGAVLSGLPALSVLAFLVVSVKVFRAARMETSTTVAIVSTADIRTLLQGVVLTLLPGTLAGITATAIYWWAGSIPADEGADHAGVRRALLNSKSGLAWSLVVMAFFTISWPVFVALLVPMLFSTIWLIGRVVGRFGTRDSTRRLRVRLRLLAMVAAIASIGYLTLSPTVWLPLRIISVDANHPIEVKGKALPPTFTAFVLKHDKEGTSLLLDSPRAVVEVAPGVVAPNPPICIPKPSSTRWLLLRASQILRFEKDYGSPYPQCPVLRL